MISENSTISVLTEIRNWIRASSFASVRSLLESVLPDDKSKLIYQMLDGKHSTEEIRVASKTSPNAVVSLAQRCTSMGLMELRADKKRVRLFDLTDFGWDLEIPTRKEDGKP